MEWYLCTSFIYKSNLFFFTIRTHQKLAILEENTV